VDAKSLENNIITHRFPASPEQALEVSIVKAKLAEYRNLFVNGKYHQELQDQAKSLLPVDLKAPSYDRLPYHSHLISEINKDFLDELYQGDIRLTVEQADYLLKQAKMGRTKRQAFRDGNYPNTIWSSGVPYTIDTVFNSTVANLIRQSVQFWQDNTCITFHENAAGPHKIIFIQDQGCYSYIGRLSAATQQISIGIGCEHLGIITHEIGHALGFFHGQSRYDRDTYVTVNIANVAANQRHNYDKETPQTNDNYGVLYDYGSVMHYADEDFAIDDKVKVLVAKDPDMQHTMGSRVQPSFDDVKVMNSHYQCSCQQSTIVCTRGGYPDPLNCNQCKCPWGFSGTYCDVRQPATNGSASCGATVAATTTWQSLAATVGNGIQALVTNMTACFWHITSPSNTVIEVQRMYIGNLCSKGCFYSGVELNMGSDFRQTGYRYCCPEDYVGNPTKTSATNLVMVAAFNRYYSAQFQINYRYVAKP